METGQGQSLLGAWETSADPTYCRSLEGVILAANVAFARKFGRIASDLTGMRLADFIHADDAGSLETDAAKILRPPHRVTSDHRWLTPQGPRWFTWEKSAVRAADGKIVAIRAVGRDITRQRIAEEQFYRLSRAVEQSPVSIIITDLDGRAQYVNSKYIEVSGNTLEDILDKKLEVLGDGHPDPASVKLMWKTVRSGGEWRGELATKRPETETIWESVKVSCLRSPSGEITNYLCLREDITERKKLEHELRQAHKMDSLGTLAGGIAHDFNNLLAIINGYAEFCLQGSADSAMLQKSLREIHRAAQRASGLVKQILTFSRKTEIKFAPVGLNQLAGDLVTLLSETFPRTVTFSLKLLDSLPPLLADQNQLQQIILNLCVNARDAMPSGGVITISTTLLAGGELRHHGVDVSKNYACLLVNDTGTGISPEIRQHIFEPFFTTKQGNNGTGLGLAVVYGIVVAHGGVIDVDSTPGVGSTFRVFLPLAAGPVIRTFAPPPGEFPGGCESLLIVDDETSLRDLLADAFAVKGYRTTTASTGLEAIDLISDPEQKFDAVLLDLNMPGANGLQVLKVIRLCRPNLRVVVVSGHITAEARLEFDHLHQRDFVQKPYALDVLARHVRQLLDAPG